MNDEEAIIRQRITEFLVDVSAWNERNDIKSALAWSAERMRTSEEEKKALIKLHGASTDSLSVLGLTYPAEHAPDLESIQSIQQQSASTALVETVSRVWSSERLFEYEMIKIGKEWRIQNLRPVLAGKEVPPPDAKVLSKLRRSRRAPLLEVKFAEGLAQLFEGPCILSTNQGEIQTQVINHSMTLSVPSGWIACDDPGYWQSQASTFELPVPPGNYPFQIVCGRPETAAVRLLIQPSAKVARYCKATRLMFKEGRARLPDRADSNGIGVDTGRIGLADAASLYEMSHYAREKMDVQACRTEGAVGAGQLQPAMMSNGLRAISFGTGGDGGFPAYWAVDADDHPIALYFDLQYLGCRHQEECAIQIHSETQISFKHPSLNKAGIKVRATRSGKNKTPASLAIAPTRCWTELAVSDSNHAIILQFDEGLGGGSSAKETSHYFPGGFRFPVGGLLHLRWNIGNSYRILPSLPQTLANTPEAFGALWRLCGCEGEGIIWQERIKQAYEGPSGRHYHNWRHLTECLVELEHASPHFSECDLSAVEMALWFHDVVYEPRAHNNEEESARGATHVLREGKASDYLIEKVNALILATKTHPEQAEPDTALLLDIDLSILGQPPERYQSYEEAIRAEYLWVPFAIFAHERRKILSRFLQRKFVYLTPYFRNRYEAQARANLKAALETLPALPD